MCPSYTQTDTQTDRHTHRTDNITSSANAEVINHIQITAGCGFSAMSVQWTHNLTFVIGESNASMGMMNLVYLAWWTKMNQIKELVKASPEVCKRLFNEKSTLVNLYLYFVNQCSFWESLEFPFIVTWTSSSQHRHCNIYIEVLNLIYPILSIIWKRLSIDAAFHIVPYTIVSLPENLISWSHIMSQLMTEWIYTCQLIQNSKRKRKKTCFFFSIWWPRPTISIWTQTMILRNAVHVYRMETVLYMLQCAVIVKKSWKFYWKEALISMLKTM